MLNEHQYGPVVLWIGHKQALGKLVHAYLQPQFSQQSGSILQEK